MEYVLISLLVIIIAIDVNSINNVLNHRINSNNKSSGKKH